jgi:hypothetical protein
MSQSTAQPDALLENSLRSGRIHSAYLVSGVGAAPGEAAERCPCEACPACRRSRPLEENVALDGTGKHGPLFRHIGEHPDLFWVARGADDTRVRIGQIRALQSAMRLGTNEGGARVAIIADAEWLNHEAQNALLRLLEEPPKDTTLILVARSAAAMLTTIRSRCVRIIFPAEERLALREADVPEEIGAIVARFDDIERLALPDLLDWAEEYRGARAVAAEKVQTLLGVGCEWLRERVGVAVHEPGRSLTRELDAFRTLSHCRRDLVQRNANPQMIAERGLFAVREAVGR